MSVVFVLPCRDTAGQERYQTITKQYYRRAQVIPSVWTDQCSRVNGIHSLIAPFLVQGIIFVYDITSKPSFQHLAKWVSDVDEVRPLSFRSGARVVPHRGPVFEWPFKCIVFVCCSPGGLVWVASSWCCLSCFTVCPRYGAEDLGRKQVWWWAKEAGDKGPRKQGLIEPHCMDCFVCWVLSFYYYYSIHLVSLSEQDYLNSSKAKWSADISKRFRGSC